MQSNLLIFLQLKAAIGNYVQRLNISQNVGKYVRIAYITYATTVDTASSDLHRYNSTAEALIALRHLEYMGGDVVDVGR